MAFSEIFASVDVDLKTASAHPLFIPLFDFVITGITFVAEDVTGTPTGSQINIGSNYPTYDNFIAGLSTAVTADGKYQYYSIGGTVNNIIKQGSILQLVVSSADTGATTNIQRVDITGYYL